MADPVYGVQTTGFARKGLATLIAEAEAEAVAIFGPSVILSPQSPMGQLIALFAHLSAMVWETAEDTYQSYDPDQGEGKRLEMLAKLRLLARADLESDESFRQAITNAGRARIDMQDVARAVRNASGVSWAQVWLNDGDGADANGIAGHSLAVAALGGDDAEIAAITRAYVVPGIGSHGNVQVQTVIDGFCRTIAILRPVEVPVWLTLNVRPSNDPFGCPPPAPTALAIALAQDLVGDTRPPNGADVTLHLLRTVMSARYPNVEIISALAGRASDTQAAVPLAIGFAEIAAFAAERITITVVP